MRESIKQILNNLKTYLTGSQRFLRMKDMFFLLNKRGSAPNSNAKGVYELKQEYQDFYSPYFYHYTRTEKTKVCFEFYSKIKNILKRNQLFFYLKKVRRVSTELEEE